jgi:hypothetical protein
MHIFQINPQKILKNYISLSSYRLTTICNNKDFGTEEKITNEINKRKNFDYYSVIVRTDPDKLEPELIYVIVKPLSTNICVFISSHIFSFITLLFSK